MANYHILPRPQGWAVKKEGAKIANKILARQDDAIKYGSKLGDYVFVHNKEGLIKTVTKRKSVIPSRKIKSKERIHVIPYKKRWAVKTEKKSRITRIFDSKYQAIRVAHEVANNRGATMVIHKANGEINHIDIPPHYQSPIADLIHMR